MLRPLTASPLLVLLLACSDVGVYGSADLMLFRWPINDVAEKELAVAQPWLIGLSWLAEDIGGRGILDRTQTTITFDAENSVTGSGGCNRYFGPVTIEGSGISFGDLAATRKRCVPALMDQEQRFFDALVATRSYRFDDLGYTLVFLSKDGTLLARFRLLAP